MSSADVEIYRNQNGHYKKEEKREYCKNCRKDITNSMFSFSYCSDYCESDHKKK